MGKGSLVTEMSLAEVTATMEVFNHHGLIPEYFKRLRQDSGLAAKVAWFIMASVRTFLPVTMDHSLTLSEMIKACGCDSNSSDINDQNFQIQYFGRHVVDWALIPAKEVLEWLISMKQVAEGWGWVTEEQVIDYLATQGLLLARIEHLLAVGATYAGVLFEYEYPIVALGSFCYDDNNRRRYPSLDKDKVGMRRNLFLFEEVLTNLLNVKCFFLAIRKAE